MIALDVMGGDFSPRASLEGALGAAKKNIPVLLCGPEKVIIATLNTLDSSWRQYPLSIVDAPEVIFMEDHPVEATSKKRKSSLIVAIEQVQKGIASACVSAGNSGAFMVAAMLLLGRKRGIERPAIGGFLPGVACPTFCLDLGANSDCKPHYLLQFAQLGLDYFKSIYPLQSPTIGLLSNGSEDTKGSILIKESFSLLKSSQLPFKGNVEPADIVTSKVDIVVCDGFSGNILLKTCEAMAGTILKQIKAIIKEKSPASISSEIMSTLQKQFDWRNQGGALLLGVNAPVIVAHGASDGYAIESALHFASQTTYTSKEQKNFQLLNEVI